MGVLFHCNAMTEEVCVVQDSYYKDINEILNGVTLQKYSSNIMDAESFQTIKQFLQQKSVLNNNFCAGGSGSNIAAGVSSLGLENIVFYGGIGYDERGNFLENEMQREYRVAPYLVRKKNPTATVFTLVSQGQEDDYNRRTFAVHLGAADNIQLNDIPYCMLETSDTLFITGYRLTTNGEKSSLKLIDVARKQGLKIILDMSCDKHIAYFKDAFHKVIDKGVYAILANEEETNVWWGIEPGSPVEVYEEAIDGYGINADIVVQKLGARGVIVSDGCSVHIPTIEIPETEFVNDNGAGDGFAAGFLGALRLGYNPQTAAEFGNYCASQVVQIVGPRMHYDVDVLKDIGARY